MGFPKNEFSRFKMSLNNSRIILKIFRDILTQISEWFRGFDEVLLKNAPNYLFSVGQ